MSKTPEEMADRLIYDLEVTDENAGDMLHSELFRLMHKYGGSIKDHLFAIAIGPNAYKAFVHFERNRASFSFVFREGGPTFHGVRIVCGPLPFFVPLFVDSGWHYAHEEAKRLMQMEKEYGIN